MYACYDPCATMITANNSRTLGIGILIGAAVFFTWCMTIMCTSFGPCASWSTGFPSLDAFLHSKYYALLLPMMIPTFIVAIVANWTFFKFFKHN